MESATIKPRQEGVKPTPPEMLEDGAQTFRQRNAIYGDNYKLYGTVMAAMFPDGIGQLTAEEHNRMGIFVQIVAKLTRYAHNFGNGGHHDSLHDIMVYSAMLQELDNDARDRILLEGGEPPF